MRASFDDDTYDAISELLQPAEPPPPPTGRNDGETTLWAPILSPKQQESFDSPAEHLLVHGEKGSGKTVGLLHKMVRHCYENRNALGLILVRVKAMATKGGAWDKLTTQILPTWRDGNRHPPFMENEDGQLVENPKAGQLIDRGLGIQYSDVKFDAQHNEYLWVENRYGEWSMIILISAPHAHQLRERIRGYEPSFVLVDELTSCGDRIYLDAVSAQVGRRPGIEGVQQYTAACNPEGPSHWVHVVWWEEAYDEETDTWDPSFQQIHVPIRDNICHLPRGYVQRLERIYRNDRVEGARMLRGEWIDRPSGLAIFREVWNPVLHVYPDPDSKLRLKPDARYPVIIGMDPGAVYNAFIFLQRLPIDGALRWIVFDEMVYLRRRLRYEVLFPVVLRRVKWWFDLVKPMNVVWIADSSAFNQFRAAGGSFDVLELERIAKLHHQKIGVPPVTVRQAPKFKNSVPTRTRLMMDLLGAGELIVSAHCKRVRAMFEKLESQTQPPGEAFDPNMALTPQRSDHIHTFDGLTYPIITGALQPQLLAPVTEGRTEVVVIGS